MKRKEALLDGIEDGTILWAWPSLNDKQFYGSVQVLIRIRPSESLRARFSAATKEVLVRACLAARRDLNARNSSPADCAI
jgi:hypothetical protein